MSTESIKIPHITLKETAYKIQYGVDIDNCSRNS